MGWVRLDDNFADHPKVVALSDSAFRTYIVALCYSNRQLTDGYIPLAVYDRIGKKGDGADLVDADLWEIVAGNVISEELITGYQIRSYDEYQPTRDKVEEKREQAKERLRKYREAQKGNADETQMKRHPQPNPTQPNPTQIDIKDNYYLETIHEEEQEYALTPAPRVKLAKEAVNRIAEKLQNASANGINAWNLSKLVEEEWDKFDPVNEVGACIALTVWYVSELQSRQLNSAEIARIGQMTKRFGRISLLAIDEAASKDLDDLVSYAFRVAQRMYADRKA